MPTDKRLEREPQLTQDLHLWFGGDRGAIDRVVHATYDELHKLAAIHFKKSEPGDTMRPTALVHETYLRFLGTGKMQIENRVQFYWFAGRLMRYILVDYLRAKLSNKRSAKQTIRLEDLGVDLPGVRGSLSVNQLLELDLGLKKLASFDERQSQIVEMYFFGGLKISEIAHFFSLSVSTIKRDIRIAKAWLANQLPA